MTHAGNAPDSPLSWVYCQDWTDGISPCGGTSRLELNWSLCSRKAVQISTPGRQPLSGSSWVSQRMRQQRFHLRLCQGITVHSDLKCTSYLQPSAVQSRLCPDWSQWSWPHVACGFWSWRWPVRLCCLTCWVSCVKTWCKDSVGHPNLQIFRGLFADF